MTQWSYRSGGGGGLPVEKPGAHRGDLRRPPREGLGTRGRHPRQRLPVVRAATGRGRRRREHRRGRHPRAAGRVARHHCRRLRGAAPEATGHDHPGRAARRGRRARSWPTTRSSPAKPDRYNRARVPAPFPVHRWSERLPDLAVLPTSTEQVAGVVRIANDQGADRAARRRHRPHRRRRPLRGGIVVDVKRMNQIKELDLENRTVTVGTGINMLKLNEVLGQHGLIYPTPGVVPLLAGRRADRHQRLAADRLPLRATARPGAQLRPRAADRGRDALPATGSAQDQQVVQRLPAQAPLHGPPGHARHRNGSDAQAVPETRGRAVAVLGLRQLRRRLRLCGGLARAGVATFAGAVLFDEWKVAYLRRDDEAYIPQPSDVRAACAVMYGYEDEVRPAAGGCSASQQYGARYLGDEISRGTGRPATTAMPRHCTAAPRRGR